MLPPVIYIVRAEPPKTTSALLQVMLKIDAHAVGVTPCESVPRRIDNWSDYDPLAMAWASGFTTRGTTRLIANSSACSDIWR